MGEKAERRSVETRRGLTLGGPWLAWEVHKGRCMQQPARREGKAGWDGFICPRRFHMFNSEVILHHIACISIIIASGHSTAQHNYEIIICIFDDLWHAIGPGIVCPHSEDRPGKRFVRVLTHLAADHLLHAIGIGVLCYSTYVWSFPAQEYHRLLLHNNQCG